MTFMRISLDKQHVYPSYASVSRNRNNLFRGLDRVRVRVRVGVRLGLGLRLALRLFL